MALAVCVALVLARALDRSRIVIAQAGSGAILLPMTSLPSPVRPRNSPSREPTMRAEQVTDPLTDHGLTVDAEGGVWVALSNGGAVRRYTPGGQLDGVLSLPARKVTACTFGGPALGQLFVTTSREGLGPGDDPLAGALFRADVGVAGQPVREFAG
jgi:hypothetical protein